MGESAAVNYKNQRKHIKIFRMSKQMIHSRFLYNVRNHCPTDTIPIPEDLNPQTIFVKLLLYCKSQTQREN